MIVMIKTTNVNMDVAAENPERKKVEGHLSDACTLTCHIDCECFMTITFRHMLQHKWPVDGALLLPERIVEKKRSQKRQRIGAATTWLTAPEWIFLSSLDGR